MKDFLGNTLNVGDAIVAALPHGRNAGASLVRGEIMRLTDSFVCMICHDYTGQYSIERRISPDKVIRV